MNIPPNINSEELEKYKNIALSAVADLDNYRQRVTQTLRDATQAREEAERLRTEIRQWETALGRLFGQALRSGRYSEGGNTLKIDFDTDEQGILTISITKNPGGVSTKASFTGLPKSIHIDL